MTSSRPPFARRLRTLNWPLVVLLVLLALARPLASVAGLGDVLGRPLTPWLLIGAVSVVWVLLTNRRPEPDPMTTLTVTGLGHGLSVILVGAVHSLATGDWQAPLEQPLSLAPILVVSAGWGALCGLAARARQGR
ncbi:hypothetical protein RM844_18030 [Streptomyces sp. DSM 44915]|uniref:Uncharacterized protein n=1 Tax=Streptomyces chisholmiae TaxID=3075540 RepID=A0ABU2JT69_9ACTN|nr:hypothetical protein [Streptomyces sp. DSM 44915]MDT0268185.1 hypothetical protein [Streptomyces sp. DSM 44915]